MKRIALALCVAIICGAVPVLLSAQPSEQSNPCKDSEAQRAWETADSPVYGDAVELARNLTERGFTVECIRRSKWERFFSGQKGAAWYKTDHGIFEAWFLPKGQSFAALEVIEQPQRNGRWVYSFSGTPPIRDWNASKQTWFIKADNVLFEVWGDTQLAAMLERTFRKP